MLDKIKKTINSLLRIQRGTGNQFATHNARETLIETKSFLRKYVRLIVGLFIAVVCVSFAFVKLVEKLIVEIVLPLLARIGGETGGARIEYETTIAYVLTLMVVSIVSWLLVRKLTGGIEVPPEERARRCPMCGEQILEMAIRCKHCGSTVGRERNQSYQTSNREASRDSFRRKEVRNPNTKIRPPIRFGRDRDQSRATSNNEGSRNPNENRARRKSSSYHVRTKDGRYHSRYNEQRNYSQRDSNQSGGNQQREQKPSGGEKNPGVS